MAAILLVSAAFPLCEHGLGGGGPQVCCWDVLGLGWLVREWRCRKKSCDPLMLMMSALQGAGATQ